MENGDTGTERRGVQELQGLDAHILEDARPFPSLPAPACQHNTRVGQSCDASFYCPATAELHVREKLLLGFKPLPLRMELPQLALGQTSS